jgi:hypothetical protein
MLGRVFAINLMGYGARPAGAGLGALIAEFYGMDACILAATALFGLQALLIVLSPVVRLQKQPEMADDQVPVRRGAVSERGAAVSGSS